MGFVKMVLGGPSCSLPLMCFISAPTRVLRCGQEEKQGGRPSLLPDEYTDLLGGFSWRKRGAGTLGDVFLPVVSMEKGAS